MTQSGHQDRAASFRAMVSKTYLSGRPRGSWGNKAAQSGLLIGAGCWPAPTKWWIAS